MSPEKLKLKVREMAKNGCTECGEPLTRLPKDEFDMGDDWYCYGCKVGIHWECTAPGLWLCSSCYYGDD